VPNILYRYEMWPITLKEEHKLQVSETAWIQKYLNLRPIESVSRLRTLNDEKICDSYRSSIIKMVKSSAEFWSVNLWKISTLQIEKKMKDNIQVNIRMILE
jgi:hypothetical protein